MKARLAPLAIPLALAVFAVVPSPRAGTGPALGHTPQVFVVAIDGTGLRQLSTGGIWRSDPTFSRDGQRLAYRGNGIIVVTLATGESRRILRNRRADFARWSPKRDELLFRYWTGDEDRLRTGIGTVRADGGRVRRLVSWPAMRSALHGPAWSPDGDRIAYLREGKPRSTGGRFGTIGGGNFDVAVISRIGGHNRRFRVRGDERQPVWSPGGRWILFGSQRRSGLQLWKISPRGRGLQRVGRRLVSAEPTWSHDGARIAFSGHYETGARDQALWVMSAVRGAIPRLVVEHVGDSEWSPVDDVIAFADFAGRLRLTAPDGTRQETIATFAPDTEFRDLTWSRDGRWLAFTAEKQRTGD